VDKCSLLEFQSFIYMDKQEIKASVEKIEKEALKQIKEKAEQAAICPEIFKARNERRPDNSLAERKAESKTGLSDERLVDGGIISISKAQSDRKRRQREIEKILEEDLEEIYLNLPVDRQKEFKAKGEETAEEINSLLDRAKIKAKKIIELIVKWLAIIPGVNRFFLEQEAKIKADEIVRMRNE